MTPLTVNEASVQAFDSIMPLAQEGAVAPDASSRKVNVPKTRYNSPSPSLTSTTTPQRAFNSIIPQAQDSTFRAGMLHAGQYRDGGGNATFTKSKFKVKPTLSDFVVDVQTVARKTFAEDPTALSYFKRTYFVEFLGIADMSDPLDLTPDGRDKYFAAHLDRYDSKDRAAVMNLDRRVRETLGAAFIEYGLYPFGHYMNHADLDVRKALE